MIKKFPLLLLLTAELFFSAHLSGADRNKYLTGHSPSPMQLDSSDGADESDEEFFKEVRQSKSPTDNQLACASAELSVGSSDKGYRTGSSSLSDGRCSAGPHSLFLRRDCQKPPSALGISPQCNAIIRPSSFRPRSKQAAIPEELHMDITPDRASTPPPEITQQVPDWVYVSPPGRKSAKRPKSPEQDGSSRKKRRVLFGAVPASQPANGVMDIREDGRDEDDDL